MAGCEAQISSVRSNTASIRHDSSLMSKVFRNLCLSKSRYRKITSRLEATIAAKLKVFVGGKEGSMTGE